MPHTLDFNDAIAAHRAWVEKLSAYVASGNGAVGLDEISDDNACALGKWMNRVAAQLASQPAFAKLEVLHRMFHTTAGDVVSLMQSQRQAMAEWLVKEQLVALSDDIVGCLNQLAAH
jgi:hypothetical protein